MRRTRPVLTEDYQSYVIVTRLDDRAYIESTFATRGHLQLNTPGYTLLPERLRQSIAIDLFLLACRPDSDTYDAAQIQVGDSRRVVVTGPYSSYR